MYILFLGHLSFYLWLVFSAAAGALNYSPLSRGSEKQISKAATILEYSQDTLKLGFVFEKHLECNCLFSNSKAILEMLAVLKMLKNLGMWLRIPALGIWALITRDVREIFYVMMRNV